MKTKVVISITEEYLANLDLIVGDLERNGVSVDHIFNFGVITGTVEDDEIETIRGLKEVASITLDKEAGIAPPDATIQ